MAISEYICRKKSLIVIQIIVALSFLFIIFGGKHIQLLMVGVGCFGFLYGAIFPMYAACVRDYFPRKITGTVLGLMSIFYGVGMMASPVLTGYLADITGTFRWSFGLGAFAAFTAALIIGYVRRRQTPIFKSG